MKLRSMKRRWRVYWPAILGSVLGGVLGRYAYETHPVAWLLAAIALCIGIVLTLSR